MGSHQQLIRGSRGCGGWWTRRDNAAFVFPRRVKPLAKIWLKEEEKPRVIVGLRRHGLGAWQAIEDDADLFLKGRLLRAPAPSTPVGEAAKDRGKDVRALNRAIDEILQVRSRRWWGSACAYAAPAADLVPPSSASLCSAAYLCVRQQLRQPELKLSLKMQPRPETASGADAAVGGGGAASEQSSGRLRRGAAAVDDPDADDFVENAPKKRKLEQTHLPGASPAPLPKEKGAAKASKREKKQSTSAASKSGASPKKSKKGGNPDEAAKSKKEGAKAAGKKAGAAVDAATDAATLSPNGKKVRQATLDATGALKVLAARVVPGATSAGAGASSAAPAAAASAPAPAAPKPLQESDPIEDAKPSVPSDETIFLDRCIGFFLCAA